MRVKIVRDYLATYEGGDLPGAGTVCDIQPDAFAAHLVWLGVAEAVGAVPVESAAVDTAVETADVKRKPRARKAASK